MTMHPDGMTTKAFEAAWGDGPYRAYSEPIEITKFIKDLAYRKTLEICAEFESFHTGSAFELDGNLSDCLADVLDEAAYRLIKASISERET